MIWRSIHYGWLDASLLFLLAFVLLWIFYSLYRYRQEVISQFADSKVRAVVVVERSLGSYVAQSAFIIVAWMCGVFALMQPGGEGHYSGDRVGSELKAPIQEIIVLVDASASMGVNDAFGGRTRLEYARDVLDGVLSGLHGQNIALYAFTSELVQVVPLTVDYLFTRLMVRQLGINEGDTSGTDLENVLGQTESLLNDLPLETVKTVVMLTDGGDTLYATTVGDLQHERQQKIVSHVEGYFKRHSRLFTVGVGSEMGGVVPGVEFKGKPVQSTLEGSLLQKLSGVGQGPYFSAEGQTPHQLADSLLEAIFDHAKDYKRLYGEHHEHEVGEKIEIEYTEYYQWPLAVALISMILSLAIPNTRRMLLSLLIFFGSAHFSHLAADNLERAAALRSAQERFESGDYSAARSLYALQLDDQLAPWETAILNYNIGTVLLAQGRWEEARTYFERSESNSKGVPLLEQRLSNNLALVELMQVQSEVERLVSDKNAKLEDYREGLDSIEDLFEDIADAESKTCALDKAKGAPECDRTWQMGKILAQAEHVKSELIESFIAFGDRNIPLQGNLASMAIKDKQQVEFLDHLIYQYTLLLGLEAIREGWLGAVIKTSGEGGELFTGEFKTAYELSQKMLDRGVEENRNGDAIGTRGSIEIARYLLMKLRFSLQKSHPSAPARELVWALEQERIGVRLNPLVQKKDHSMILDYLKEIHSGAMLAAEGFIRSAPTIQRESYETPKALQSIPWGEVIPLVEQGEALAVKIQEQLAIDPNSTSIVTEQEKVIEKWKQAVALMKRGSERNEAESNAPIPLEKSDQKIDGSGKFDRILQSIQEMEVDDRSKPEWLSSPNSGEVERPW